MAGGQSSTCSSTWTTSKWRQFAPFRRLSCQGNSLYHWTLKTRWFTSLFVPRAPPFALHAHGSDIPVPGIPAWARHLPLLRHKVTHQLLFFFIQIIILQSLHGWLAPVPLFHFNSRKAGLGRYIRGFSNTEAGEISALYSLPPEA